MSAAEQNQIRRRGYVSTFVKVTAGLLFAGTITSGEALATTDTPETPSTKVEIHKRWTKHASKRVKGHVTAKVGTLDLSPLADAGLVKGPVPALTPACSQQSAKALEATYGLKGWIIPPPHFGESIDLDYGCWRSTLAKYGFGEIGYNSTTMSTNILDHYTPPGQSFAPGTTPGSYVKNQQIYVGQRPTAGDLQYQFVTYDLSQYGVPDGQLAAGYVKTVSTYDTIFPRDAFNLVQASYYQTFAHKMFEFEIGYIPLNTRFAGTQVGGNIYNPLGPGGLTQSLVGAGNSPEITPAAIATWHVTDKFYDRAAISRSTPGTAAGGPSNTIAGSGLLIEHYTNPTGLSFANSHPCYDGVCYPSPRELFINEMGYKNLPSAGSLSTWIRADGYYNNTQYSILGDNAAGKSLSTAAAPAYKSMAGGQILADQQLWQSEPGNDNTAYKGVYFGATVGYVDPSVSFLSQDYSVRIYSYGLFGRPKDQIAFIAERQVYSDALVTANNLLLCNGTATETCFRHAVDTYTLTYNANIISGVFASVGVQYVDHPSFSWSPVQASLGSASTSQLAVGHSLGVLLSTFVVF